MVIHEPIKSFTASPSVRRPDPAPAQAPPAEVAHEQPAVARQRHSEARAQRLETIQYRLQHRRLDLGEIRQRAQGRRAALHAIQAELDQLSSPQDYLDNYEEIERLECLRAQLQRDQDAELRPLRSYQKQSLNALDTRGAFWTRLVSGRPCPSEGPPPGSPW